MHCLQKCKNNNNMEKTRRLFIITTQQCIERSQGWRPPSPGRPGLPLHLLQHDVCKDSLLMFSFTPAVLTASRSLQMTTCSLGLHLGATPSLFLIYPMAEFPTNLASTTSKSSSLTGSWLPSGHTGVSPPGLSELAVLGPESTAPPPGDSDSWTVRGGTGHLGEAGSRYHVQLQGALCPASPCATVGWGLRAIRHRRPEPDVALAADKALRQGGPRFSLCGLVPSLTGAAPPH